MKSKSRPSFLLSLFSISAGLTLTGQAANLAGVWLFDNGANPAEASFGSDLVFEGTAPTHSASVADDGAASQTGVITTAAALSTNRIRVDHGIAGNGGGAFVNQYSIVADILSPVGSRGSWRTIYQTNTANSNDGEYFIRNTDDFLGVSALTYSPAIDDTIWTRLVITVDLSLGGNDVLTYLNGALHFTHPVDEALDLRFSLDPFFYVFTDNDGDNAPLHVGALAVYDGVLTPAEVSALGAAGTAIPIPEPSSVALLGLVFGLGLWRRR